MRRALKSISTSCLDAIASAESRPAHVFRISVSGVLRAAALGRSQLYATYPFLLGEIHEAREEVDRARREKRWERAKSRAELEATIRELKIEMERRVATIASQQLSQLKEKVTPEARERDRLTAENADLREKLARAEHTHMMQTAMVRKLMAANNTRKSG